MRIKKLSFAVSTAVILAGASCAATLYWNLGSWRSPLNLKVASSQQVSKGALCRARLYLQKVQGAVPNLSWTELWRLTLLKRGFHCIEGSSLEASLQYSADASEDDLRAGGSFFRERCTACHGIDGAGGPGAPSLKRLEYKHGDSDLAIYQVIRDGVRGTAMPSHDVSVR